MPVVIKGATSGSVSLAAPATGGDTTIDLSAIPQANIANLSSDLAAKAPAVAAAVQGYNTVAQTLANGTWTALNLNTESYDTDAFHSTSTNTSRLVVPAGLAGMYIVSGFMQFASNATGIRSIQITKNASGDTASTSTATASGAMWMQANAVMKLAVGDYVELNAYQNSGGNLDVTAGNTVFRMVRVGS